MARIVQETIVITISKLVRSQDEADPIATEDLVLAVEAMATELVNDGTVVVEASILPPEA